MTRRTLAAALTGLVSLSLVGVALANEPDDPALTPVEDEPCEEVVVDGGTTDGTDGATDGTDGTTDGTDGTTDGTDTTDGGEDGCETGTDGTTTDGTDGTDGTTDDDDVVDEALEVEDPELEEGERPQNHGWYVSEATKTCPESGRERGECISEVAKSDLGKPHADDEAEEGADDEPTVGSTGEAGPTERPAKAAKPSKGNGGGKGRGARG